MSTILHQALTLAARGYPVVIVRPNGKDPAIAGAGWQAKATTDLSKVRGLFRKSPNANYGLLVREGECVVDNDPRNGGTEESVTALGLPPTWTVRTPGGGHHRRFRLPAGVHLKTCKLGPGIDLICTGLQCVGPGSVRDGKTYQTVDHREPAELPVHIVEMACKRAAKERDAGNTTPMCELDMPSSIAWCERYISDQPAGPTGQVNALLVQHVDQLKDHGLSEDKCWELVEPWLNKSGCDNERKDRGVVASRYANGLKRPGCACPEVEFENLMADPETVALLEEHSRRLKARAPGEPEVVGKSNKPARFINWPKATAKGVPYPNHVLNVAAVLSFARQRVRFNEFSRVPEIETEQGFVDLTDEHLNKLWALAQAHGLPAKFNDFFRLVSVLASRNKVHPVREYLSSLQWDGTPRVDTWLTRYLGVPDTVINRAFGKSHLFGSVMRIFAPGTKHDLMLVLEGKQGKDKSTAIETLCGKDWYADGLQLGDKAQKLIEATRGIWLAEAPELSGLPRAEVEKIKAQLSCKVDRARAVWDKLSSAVPRQFTLWGTTNSLKYLKDATGNRRFAPVTVGAIDIPALAADRDQIWAECVARIKAGEDNKIPPELWDAAAEVQEERREVDPMEEAIEDAVADLAGAENGAVILKHLIWFVLGFDEKIHKRTKSQDTAIQEVMRKLGWTPTRLRYRGTGARCRVFVKLVGKHEPKWFTVCEGTRLYGSLDEVQKEPLDASRM